MLETTPLAIEPTRVNRSRLPLVAIGVWAAILALIVAIGVAFGGHGATPDTGAASLTGAGAPGGPATNLNAPLAADPSATPAPSASSGTTQGGQPGGRGPRGFAFGGPAFGGPDGGGPRGPGFGPGGPSAVGPFFVNGRGAISITAMSGNSLSLKTDDGWTRTIDASNATITEQGGGTLTVGDLKVGDHILFRETRNSDGTYTISAIVRIPAQTGGTVKSVSGNSIVITLPDNSTQTITTTSTTTYSLNGKAAAAADVKVGTRLRATGSEDGSGNFTATKVDISPASVAGSVTAKTADTITIKGQKGDAVTIHVTSSTSYQTRGNGTASLAGINTGDQVEAEGTQNADGSLNADTVRYGMGGGFRRPFGGPNGGGNGQPNAPAPSTTTN